MSRNVGLSVCRCGQLCVLRICVWFESRYVITGLLFSGAPQLCVHVVFCSSLYECLLVCHFLWRCITNHALRHVYALFWFTADFPVTSGCCGPSVAYPGLMFMYLCMRYWIFQSQVAVVVHWWPILV